VNQADPLTSRRWKLTEDIFHQAAQLEEPARDALVERLCGDDRPLLHEVRRLLSSLDAIRSLTPDSPPTAPRTLSGARLGSYRLGMLLGQGGMSSVYLANRDDGQFEQKVAVKLMSPHLTSEFFTGRFRRERQILADLDHPNTTRLIDGGVSETGDPYLVMEYVDGQPVDQYCDQRRLSIRERIRLFVQISAALQYAHHRQVVHRDLKPGNILVTSQGVPKLLDFGTAKLVSPDADESTTTRFGMMTPRYASPEQLSGDGLTAATDVYSLGVVLFESVTGLWPFGNPESIIDGLERAAGKVKAPKASELVTDEAAALRSTTKSQMASEIKGDLERILAKALQLKPEDRYSSVELFAADLQLFLEGEPAATANRPPWWKGRPIQVALSVLALAILVVALRYSVFRQSIPAEAARSIVVLPFANSDAKDQYLSDGLTQDVTDELSRSTTLRVIARPSALGFAGKNLDLTKLSRQLNVGLVLAGQIERSDTGLNVRTQLERAPGGEIIWSHTYRVQGLNLARVHSDITSSVSSVLRAQKSSSVRRDTKAVDDQAYDLTQRAAHEMQQHNLASYAKADQYLRKATEIDPQYARARFLLGSLSYNMNGVRGNQVRTDHEVQEAVTNWRKALELEPEFGAARALLAKYELQYHWNWMLAESELQKAVALAPDVNAESTYSFLLLFQRRFAEAESHRRRADELDPASTENLTNSGLFWFQASNFKRSLEALDKLKTRSASEMMTIDYIAQGRPSLALRMLQKGDRPNPANPFFRAMVSAASGNKMEALRAIRQLETEDPSLNVPRQWFALVYALIGDEANTLKWLNRSADAHEWMVLNIAVHPFYKDMQGSPEFRALKRRIGLAP
jgi:eukaryotic-like serine/threonine-protein kinase